MSEEKHHNRLHLLTSSAFYLKLAIEQLESAKGLLLMAGDITPGLDSKKNFVPFDVDEAAEKTRELVKEIEQLKEKKA